jgi:hypothetical protein
VSVLTLCIDISEGCFRGQIRRLIVNLQPRSLKSHATAVAFPAYVLGHRPVAQIICASYARLYGGGRGIRTPGTLSGTVVFKTTRFNRSRIPPRYSLSVARQSLHRATVDA